METGQTELCIRQISENEKYSRRVVEEIVKLAWKKLEENETEREKGKKEQA